MPHMRFGAMAEFVVVPGARLSKAPTNVPLIDAAALPAVGTTVIRALSREARLAKGERLLVCGAGGGVGSTAVQYARWLGAHVTALAGSSVLPWLREVGVDETFDHRITPLGALGRFDVVLDVVGTQMVTLRRMLDRGGRMVELGFDPEHPLRSVATIAVSALHGSRRIRTFSNDPSQGEIAQLASLVEEGAIRPLVEKVWTIDQIVPAFQAIENGGVRGKHVVRLGRPDDSSISTALRPPVAPKPGG